jgi:Cys-rich four helix bundle protein (predicted Tat secretion target)
MIRRELLGTAGVLGAVLAAGSAGAEDKKEEKKAAAPEHEHHHAPAAAGVVAAAHDCLAAGDACLQHCIEALAAGDKAMVDCARSVNQMLATCQAISKLAAQGAPLLKDLAAVCAKACRECEAQCKKHEQHPPCKRCAETCARCASECEKLA